MQHSWREVRSVICSAGRKRERVCEQTCNTQGQLEGWMWSILGFKVLLGVAPVREVLGCTGTSAAASTWVQPSLGMGFGFCWALGFAGKGIEEPCSSSLGWAFLYSYPIQFSKKHKADFSVNRTKPLHAPSESTFSFCTLLSKFWPFILKLLLES